MAATTVRSSSPPRPPTQGNDTISTASEKSLADERRTSVSTSFQTVNTSWHSSKNDVESNPRHTSPPSSKRTSEIESPVSSKVDLHPPDLLLEEDEDENEYGGSDSQSYAPSSPARPEIFNATDRGAPGDGALMAMVKRAPEDVKAQKRKNQFYSEVFAYREAMVSPRERVVKDSIVSAHVKTNVIIADEYTFLTSLSSFLSARYSRPPSSILITLDHSACLLFGGSFDPAYYLTISALPSQVQATVNKRNAALIQNFFDEELHVVPSRGVVRFEAVPEECLATGGVTVQGEIESLAAGNARKAAVAHHTRSDSGDKGRNGGMGRSPVKESFSIVESGREVRYHEIPNGNGGGKGAGLGADLKAREEKARKMGKRKSLMQMLGAR